MSAEIYSTLFESGAARRVKRTANLQPDPDGRELEVVNLYPEVKYQSVDGFGGAITAAVGDTLSRMPAGTAEEIMEAYFGPSGQLRLFIEELRGCVQRARRRAP